MLLRAYCVPGNVLGPGNTMVNETEISALLGLRYTYMHMHAHTHTLVV